MAAAVQLPLEIRPSSLSENNGQRNFRGESAQHTNSPLNGRQLEHIQMETSWAQQNAPWAPMKLDGNIVSHAVSVHRPYSVRLSDLTSGFLESPTEGAKPVHTAWHEHFGREVADLTEAFKQQGPNRLVGVKHLVLLCWMLMTCLVNPVEAWLQRMVSFLLEDD